jgi:uncharacterized membrane protein YgcG
MLRALLFAAASGSARCFTPGAICSHVNESMAASDFLRGRHLRVMETPWAPFAIADPEASHGWRGLDADLLAKLSASLGFTYEIVHFTKNASEGDASWTDALFRVAAQSDLVMSYWTRTQARMDHVVQIAGHIDMSSVLAARLDIVEVTLTDRIVSFLRPYTYSLWGLLVAMTLTAGIVDYLLEFRHEGTSTLGASLYEYVGGMLWGGFSEPRTKVSAVYQIVMSFIVLVTISTYTANLAAFITLSAAPSLSASSIEDVMARGQRVCSYTDNPQVVTYDAIYPRLQIEMYEARLDMRDALVENRGCDAVILPRITYDTFKMSEAACKMQLAQTVFPGAAGWVTNRQSSCLQQAFEWALVGLEELGETQKLYFDWLPEYNGCGSAPLEEEEEGEGSRLRRQLGVRGEAGLSDAYDSMGMDDSRHSGRRRRLQSGVMRQGHGGGGGGGGGGGKGGVARRRSLVSGGSSGGVGDGGADDELGQMGPMDFLGLWILYGVATVGALTISVCGDCFSSKLGRALTRRRERKARKRRDADGSLNDPSSVEKRRRPSLLSTITHRMGLTSEEDSPRTAHLKEHNLSVDDMPGMLKVLFFKTLEIQKQQETVAHIVRELAQTPQPIMLTTEPSKASTVRPAASASPPGGLEVDHDQKPAPAAAAIPSVAVPSGPPLSSASTVHPAGGSHRSKDEQIFTI